MIMHTLDELNALLAGRRYCANGKNAPMGHLYETVAESRWPQENLFGVYLTNPDHAWMAVWMAITRRERLRKRQLRYVSPDRDAGDCIGRIEIYNPEHIRKVDLFCERAHLNLFDAARFAGASVVDVSRESDKVAALEERGFRRRSIERRGWVRDGYVSDAPEKQVVYVDRWQMAVVNFGELIPDIPVVLEKELIADLAERATFCTTEIGEAYIV